MEPRKPLNRATLLASQCKWNQESTSITTQECAVFQKDPDFQVIVKRKESIIVTVNKITEMFLSISSSYVEERISQFST